jgi:hypothetical protein
VVGPTLRLPGCRYPGLGNPTGTARHNRQLAANRPKKDNPTYLCTFAATLKTRVLAQHQQHRRRFLGPNLIVKKVGGRRRVRDKKRRRNVLQEKGHGRSRGSPARGGRNEGQGGPGRRKRAGRRRFDGKRRGLPALTSQLSRNARSHRTRGKERVFRYRGRAAGD